MVHGLVADRADVRGDAWLRGGSVRGSLARDAMRSRIRSRSSAACRSRRRSSRRSVDRDELRARLVKLAAEQKTQTETRAEGLALARWGMIPLDTDYLR